MNDRIAARNLLVFGALLVVLAAAPYRLFDLDRFFAPKELVLHSAALALALLGLRRVRTLEFGLIDLSLAAYLGFSCFSALLAADNWLAARALAVTLSGAAVFWSSRAAAAAGARRSIVAAAGAAAALAAAASLAQAYGLDSSLFSLHRVPGGLLGNRNFMAHLAVIGAPALICATLLARRPGAALAGALGVAVLADALVLSRSRAAYLGLLAGAAVVALGIWRARGLRVGPEIKLRLKTLALAAALGLLAAPLVPNRLEWRSGSPYLDTVTGMVNYRRGSGHGRLVQYARTLRMAARHPALGVGPGNWPLVYPKFAGGYDPSLTHGNGKPMNPWPSSDWMAVISERGLPALAALLLVFGGLLAAAWRQAAAAGSLEEQLFGLTLAATLLVTAVAGSFDAVLLLAAPTFIAWALFGALAPAAPALWSAEVSPGARRRLALAVALLGSAAVLRSACQLAGMALYSKARTLSQFTWAARLAPGNDRIRARLAALQSRRNAAPAAEAAAGQPAGFAVEEPAPAPEEPAQAADGDETGGDQNLSPDEVPQ